MCKLYGAIMAGLHPQNIVMTIYLKRTGKKLMADYAQILIQAKKNLDACFNKLNARNYDGAYEDALDAFVEIKFLLSIIKDTKA